MTPLDRLLDDVLGEEAEWATFVARMERRGYGNTRGREDQKPKAEGERGE